MILRPACGQARFPLFGFWCPNHAPDVDRRVSQVFRRLYAVYVRSRARHRDRRISRSSGVSKARHCLLRALSLDSRCCRASTLSVARRFVARWRFLVELSSTDMFHTRQSTRGEPTYVKLEANVRKIRSRVLYYGMCSARRPTIEKSAVRTTRWARFCSPIIHVFFFL